MKKIENIPDAYFDALSSNFLGVVLDVDLFAIFECGEPKSQKELVDWVNQSINESSELLARYGYLEEQPIVVCIDGDFECSGTVYSGEIELSAEGKYPNRCNIVLLIKGNLKCESVFVGPYSHLGVGGDLRSKVLWCDGSNGAWVSVSGKAQLEFVKFGQDIHDLQYESAPINLGELGRVERLKPECRRFSSFIELVKKGSPIVVTPKRVILKKTNFHVGSLKTFSFTHKSKGPDEYLCVPRNAKKETEGGWSLVLESPPDGYEMKRAYWREDGSLKAIHFYPLSAESSYDYVRFHNDGSVSMIAQIEDEVWVGRKVDFTSENRSDEYFITSHSDPTKVACAITDMTNDKGPTFYNADWVRVDKYGIWI